jgi:prefoldin subunit 5
MTVNDTDTTGSPARPERWHIGKEIPIALIATLMMSVGSGVWYASKTDARITMLERTAEQNGGLRDDIVTLKEQIRNIDRLLTRVENILDRRAGDADHQDRPKLGGIEP